MGIAYNRSCEKITVEPTFQGFNSDSFEFFRQLAENNNKAWFDQNRERYEQHIVGGFRGLLRGLEPFLLKLNPHFETAGKTNGNLSRINRDIRFSKDKSPYKSNYYLYVFDGRHERDETGQYYVGLSADCLTVGFRIYATWGSGPKGALEKIFRKRFEAHEVWFDRQVQKIVRGRRYETYWHRMEKGDWAQHPGLPRAASDWLTLHAWIARKVFLPNSRALASPSFLSEVQKIFADLFPFYVFTSVASTGWRNFMTSAGFSKLKRKMLD